MRRLLTSASLGLWLGLYAHAAPVDSSQFAETTFANSTDLNLITSMAWAPDNSGRLFVTRKAGEVRVIQNGTLVGTPWVTFPSVHTFGECGLLGICFDPDFLNNRYVYFFITVSGDNTAGTGVQQIIR